MHLVRRDLAVEMPPFEEEGNERSLEQIAEDERDVGFVMGVEYISDPNFERAKRILEGDDRVQERKPSHSTPPTTEELADRAVFGGDGRSSKNSTAHNYPERTAVLLRDGAGQCTATMVGAATAVTAAHCVHNGSSLKSPIHNHYFGNATYGPFGSLIRGGAMSACWFIWVKNGWDGDEENVSEDYGVFDYRSCPTLTTGWLGVSTTVGWDVSHYVGGYPGTTPDGTSMTLWWHGNDSQDNSTFYPDRFFHRIDTSAGQSGGGIYRISSGGDRYVTAIHSGYYNSWPDYFDDNQGRVVDNTVFDFLEDHGL